MPARAKPPISHARDVLPLAQSPTITKFSLTFLKSPFAHAKGRHRTRSDTP